MWVDLIDVDSPEPNPQPWTVDCVESFCYGIAVGDVLNLNNTNFGYEVVAKRFVYNSADFRSVCPTLVLYVRKLEEPYEWMRKMRQRASHT